MFSTSCGLNSITESKLHQMSANKHFFVFIMFNKGFDTDKELLARISFQMQLRSILRGDNANRVPGIANLPNNICNLRFRSYSDAGSGMAERISCRNNSSSSTCGCCPTFFVFPFPKPLREYVLPGKR